LRHLVTHRGVPEGCGGIKGDDWAGKDQNRGRSLTKEEDSDRLKRGENPSGAVGQKKILEPKQPAAENAAHRNLSR